MHPSPASPKRKRRPRLIALGDLTLDIVVAREAAVVQGSDVAGRIAFRVGGSAANAARSFAALGGEAVFVGAVGDDPLGRRLVRALRAAGVRTRVSVVSSVATARIAVLLGARGERSFVTARGAADCLAGADLRRSWFRGAGAVHLPAYSLLAEPLASAAARAAEWAHSLGALVSVDLSSAEPLRAAGAGHSWDAVASVDPDLLFANTDEGAVLGRPLLDLAAIVVIKEGAEGCRVSSRSMASELHVPTEPIGVTDSTGAGDAFDAGFLFALLSTSASDEDGLRQAARAGHAAARALLTSPRPELAL